MPLLPSPPPSLPERQAACGLFVRAWVMSVVLVSAPDPRLWAGPDSLSALASAEIQRRQTLVNDAYAQIQEGRLLLENGKTSEAVAAFSSAYQSLPPSTLSDDARAAAREGFAVASVTQAREWLREGRYPQAEAALNAVLDPDMAPGFKPAVTLLAEMKDPDRWPPALTPAHIDKVEKVQDLLILANSNNEIGAYDQAINTYLQVLAIDPYNSAARRGMEVVEQHRADYFDTARDHTRARSLATLDSLWEDSIPPSAEVLSTYSSARTGSLMTEATKRDTILQKLQTLIVPQIDFAGATLDEVAEFLRVRSRDLDPDGRGVDFILDVPPETASRPIDLTLSNMPLEQLVRYAAEKAGARYKVESYAVKFVSLTSESKEVLVKRYKVPPGFLETTGADAATAPGANDPFAPTPGTGSTGLTIRRLTAKEFLEARGVSFPEGTSASYSTATNSLVVRNTPVNMEIIDLLVEQAASNSPKQAHISVKMIEVTQNHLEELGFDWLLGAFNVPGSNGVFASGGTDGNGRDAGALATDFPLNTDGVPVGQFPMTSGLRSSGDILGTASIDSVLGENVTAQSTLARSPGQFALSGVLSDPQFQLVIRALDQNKGVDFVAMPSIVAKSGQKATIDLATELLYPTEFDPPEVPQDTSGVDLGGLNLRLLGDGSGPITPATPTTFEMRKVGTLIEMEPVISADGREIEILITPEVVQFEGFIDYGSDINNSIGGSPQPVDNRIIQPIFRTNRVSTAVKVNDGATVVLGGILSEERIQIEDKVPVLGSIPIAGRLWQSEVSRVIQKNFIVFVTVKVIDPSGQRVNRQGIIVDAETAGR